MSKIIYTAEESRINADADTLAISFDKQECVKAAEMKVAHLTKREQENTIVSVQGFDIPVEDGQTAEEAYHEFMLNACCGPDPVEYEVIK